MCHPVRGVAEFVAPVVFLPDADLPDVDFPVEVFPVEALLFAAALLLFKVRDAFHGHCFIYLRISISPPYTLWYQLQLQPQQQKFQQQLIFLVQQNSKENSVLL